MQGDQGSKAYPASVFSLILSPIHYFLMVFSFCYSSSQLLRPEAHRGKVLISVHMLVSEPISLTGNVRLTLVWSELVFLKSHGDRMESPTGNRASCPRSHPSPDSRLLPANPYTSTSNRDLRLDMSKTVLPSSDSTCSDHSPDQTP